MGTLATIEQLHAQCILYSAVEWKLVEQDIVHHHLRSLNEIPTKFLIFLYLLHPKTSFVASENMVLLNDTGLTNGSMCQENQNRKAVNIRNQAMRIFQLIPKVDGNVDY